jgi:hypothetical protein
MQSLFGEEIPEKDEKPKRRGKYQAFKEDNNYRKALLGEGCRNCHFGFKTAHRTREYWKCEKMGVSHSESSDVRAFNICDLYKRRDLYE